jgi:hypothetical protein
VRESARTEPSIWNSWILAPKNSGNNSEINSGKTARKQRHKQRETVQLGSASAERQA